MNFMSINFIVHKKKVRAQNVDESQFPKIYLYIDHFELVPL